MAWEISFYFQLKEQLIISNAGRAYSSVDSPLSEEWVGLLIERFG
ncbi:MAG TPA: hypothetical protein VE866_16345 [Candidatus Binatia bacterium]|nr:hypothetical protein [Candidatus Binatia bacterium]